MKQCTLCKETFPPEGFYKNGKHLSARCKSCAKKVAAEWYANNKERALLSSKRAREANPERGIEAAKKWAETNRERSREIKAAWKKRNPDVVRRQAREAARKNPEKQAARKRAYNANNRDKVNASVRRRRASNSGAMIAMAIGNGMRAAIRKAKAGRRWESIVGYDLPKLMVHLESLFVEGMSWENFGAWHIDHRRPVASFDFSENVDLVTQQCWAISNLQPLWAKDNMRKGARWDGEA